MDLPRKNEGAAAPAGGVFSFLFHSSFNITSRRAIGAVVAQLLYTETVGGSNPSSPTIFALYGFPSFNLHKRWYRAIERIGDGAEQFGLGFLNHTVHADGAHTGFQQILLMIGTACASRSSAGSSCCTPHCSRGSNCRSLSFGARRWGAPASNAFEIATGSFWPTLASGGQHDGAIGHKRLERVKLDRRLVRFAKLRREMMENNFCRTNSNSSIFHRFR